MLTRRQPRGNGEMVQGCEGGCRVAPSGLGHSPATPARNRVEEERGGERRPAQAANSSSSWGGGRAGQITGASVGSVGRQDPVVTDQVHAGRRHQRRQLLDELSGRHRRLLRTGR